MLADQVDVVVGVDTHRDSHALAVVGARRGQILSEFSIAADPAGYEHARALVQAHGRGTRAWAIEGAGSYGAGLRRHLMGAGERIVAIDRPSRHLGRAAAKSDSLDAVRIARSALVVDRPPEPRADGLREALRVLMVARSAQIEARARAITRIRALAVSAPEPLRRALTAPGLGRTGLLERCAALRPGAYRDPAMSAVAEALRSLGRLGRDATRQGRAHELRLASIVAELAPGLLAEPGVGPITGAQVILSWSHPGRIHSEAAFARLGGVAPIPASSGQVVRHRLDRGGDRQLNRALHTILMIRRQRDPATRAYIARRMAEGRSSREAIRCLKRYLARHLFRLLEAMPQGVDET